MPGSKRRPLWSGLPASVHEQVEALLHGQVVAAANCEGGFSPGFASRLTLADGRRAFVKALDCDAWPFEAPAYLAEARLAPVLPADLPAPRCLATLDDEHWVILAFECIDGKEPAQPWSAGELARATSALSRLSRARIPPSALSSTHPRLGGWAEIASDQHRLARLPGLSSWAAERTSWLVDLDEQGMVAAQGTSLVHFDPFAHNILMTADEVFFVDWPHARLGAAFVDLILLLTSAGADGLDPEAFLRAHPLIADVSPQDVDAVLAAVAGFYLAGALTPASPGLEPITNAKRRLGRAAITWLERRFTGSSLR